MHHIEDQLLDDHIIATASDAEALGDPIEVGRGPGYDKRLKRRLGPRGVHQSVVCSHVNGLVEQGRLREVTVGRHVVIMGQRTREYPLVKILPA